MLNIFLNDMRKKTSPVGLVVAQAYKPGGLSYDVVMEKYAERV
jgi:hypothetical protein